MQNSSGRLSRTPRTFAPSPQQAAPHPMGRRPAVAGPPTHRPPLTALGLGVTKDVWKPCNPLKSHKTAKALFGKGLEQNTRVLEKLGKRLGGRLYSATVGASGLRSS